jgi:glyoxylase-like metal-dependent hydrolase (beta-lactamase superfamily II)
MDEPGKRREASALNDIREDIIEVPLPLPFALKVVNCYLIKGKNGFTIIDTGLHTDQDLQVWEEAQAKHGWSWNDVEKIVLTHYHPDHYGLAGTLQQLTNAPVYLSRTDWEQAQFFFGRKSDMPERMAAFFAEHGLTEDWVKKIPGHLRSFHSWVEPHPEPTWIAPGETIRMGDRDYQVIHTPGHADGHLSFYDPERQIMIGGDFLLPKITPNISLWPGADPNPLATYLSTLDKMKKVPVKRIFPAHGNAFTHYRERIAQLEEHHEARLQLIAKYVRDLGEPTAYDVCKCLFGDRLSIHNLRFALSETLAHLEYLRVKGKMDLFEKEGTKRYRCKVD